LLKNRFTYEQDTRSVVKPQNFISMRRCVSQHDLDKKCMIQICGQMA